MLEVTNKRLVILPDPPEKFSEGGIEIPDTATEKPISGVVLLSQNEKLKEKRVYCPDYCAMPLK